MTATIRVEDVSRIYRVGRQERHALHRVSLTVAPGRIVVLRGRSGSGKTTLLNCIGGLDRPDFGRIWVTENEITQLPEHRLVHLRRRRIGFVFQSHALLPTYSARENVDLMLRMTSMPRRARRARVEEVLSLVGLGKWMEHRPHELSGGQQQRVAIARSLAPRPAIILADEPTGELDIATGQQVLALFRQIADIENTTVFIATHDLTADTYADEVYYLKDGQIAV